MSPRVYVTFVSQAKRVVQQFALLKKLRIKEEEFVIW
jgi:hypothetical protein